MSELLSKLAPDGRTITVDDGFTFGKTRIHISSQPGLTYDDAWQYDGTSAAVVAFLKWDGVGEPEGWFRNPPSGRRRPDGDPDKEYVYG